MLPVWWGLVLVVSVLPFAPLPHSRLGWLLLVLLGPPAAVLGEAFFGWAFSDRHGSEISQRTFSVARVAVGVAAMLAFVTILYFILRAFGLS
jgi:hypothetical protein